MDVLFSLLDAGVGGGQQVALGIAEALVERGHGIGVVVPAPGPATERLEQLGATVHVAPLVSLRRPGVLKGARIARAYDLVYSHTSVPGEILGGAAAALARRPHVIHRHAHPHLSPNAAVRLVQRALYRGGARRPTVIAVAEHIAASVGALGVPRSRIHVIGNGVVVPERPPPRDGGSLPRVGLLGRLDPQKGVDLFVRAVRGLEAEAVLGAPVVTPGFGEEMVEAARAAGVEVLVPPPAGFLEGLDVVALPSSSEGHPLVLLEAMALGKAIVASAIPGVRETVGRAGLLVPSGDEKALAGALRELVADPARRAELGARARELAASRYALADVHERVIAVLEQAGAGAGIP